MENIEFCSDDLMFNFNEAKTSLRITHRHQDIDFQISDEQLEDFKKFLSMKSENSFRKLTEKQIADINKWLGKSKNQEGGYVYDVSQYLSDSAIEIDMTTSGYQGGSCWGSEARPFDNDVSLDDVTVLNKILETLIPNISSEKCRKIFYLLQSECQPVENTEREYYGNSTDTITWNIPLEIFYKVVQEAI